MEKVTGKSCAFKDTNKVQMNGDDYVEIQIHKPIPVDYLNKMPDADL
jgi:hypothetical protein